MIELFAILWLPATIALMAVTFVVVLGSAAPPISAAPTTDVEAPSS